MILDDEWLLRDLVALDEEVKWQVVGVNEASVRAIEVKGYPEWRLQDGCRWGSLWLVRLAVSRGAANWDAGLHGACQGGQRDLVNLMIDQGATNWNHGIWGACEGGHRDLVDLMIEKGGAINWDLGLGGACWEGHRELVDMMIEKGATSCYSGRCPGHEFNEGAQ
jgi:hypothetical protein